MPTYEYACNACGEHLEVVQSFKDDPLTTCAACGGAVRRVFSPIGVVFKGSGFYKTDSRGSGGARSSASSDTGGDKAGGDKAGGDKAGGDKKPADAASTGSSGGTGSSGTSGSGASGSPSKSSGGAGSVAAAS